MSYIDMTLKEYYFLKDRESFSLDPWRDREVYFGGGDLTARITNRVENDFLQPRGVPKFFIYGAWGSGKTHTLAYIAYKLETGKMHPAEPIYMDVAPLTAKEHYQRIHSRLIDAVGPDRIRSAAEAVADIIPGSDKVQGFLDENILQFGDDTLRISQANIFRNFLFGGSQSQLSWEWLKGRKNTPDQAAMLGVQKDVTEPTDFVNCLLNIGSLCNRGLSKKLVFLVDEAESFRYVTNPDSQAELIHMIRLLLENSNKYVGFIFAVQAEAGMEDIGEFFTRDDIRRRVDYDLGYIDLSTMVSQIQSARDFMLHVLAYLVDQEQASKVIKSEGLDVSKEAFPFTEDAIDTISNHVAEHMGTEIASPAFILSTMSNAAINAWRRRDQSEAHVLIDRSTIEETIFPEG